MSICEQTLITVTLYLNCKLPVLPVTSTLSHRSELHISIPDPTTAETDTSVAPTETEIDDNHPEVRAMVEQAMAAARDQDISLPPETYITVMEEAIEEAEKEMRQKIPDGPL